MTTETKDDDNLSEESNHDKENALPESFDVSHFTPMKNIRRVHPRSPFFDITPPTLKTSKGGNRSSGRRKLLPPDQISASKSTYEKIRKMR